MSWNPLKIFGGQKKGFSEQPVPENNHSLSANDAKGWVVIGKSQLERKDFNGACASFTKALETSPEEIEAFLGRAKAKQGLGDDKGFKRDANMADVLFQRLDNGLNAHDKAEDLYEADDYEGAIREFDKAVSLGIKTSSTYYYRGLCKHFLKQYHEAIEDYTTAMSMDGVHKDVHINRGRAYQYVGENTLALADFDRVIATNPTDEVYMERGRVNSKLGLDEAAIEDYNKALKINPLSAEAHFLIGMKHAADNSYQSAISSLDKAISLGKDHHLPVPIATAYSIAANLKFIHGDYSGAIRDYTSAINYEPSDGSNYYFRSNCYATMGDKEKELNDRLRAYQLGYVEED